MTERYRRRLRRFAEGKIMRRIFEDDTLGGRDDEWRESTSLMFGFSSLETI